MSEIHVVSVRALAEFSCLTGDLLSAGASLRQMSVGTLGHKKLQALLGDDWTIEEPISRDEPMGEFMLRVQGRADGVLRDETGLAVLEIKTTRRPLQAILPDDHPAHWAQAELYAYLFCAKEGRPEAVVELCYCRVEDMETRRFRRTCSFEALRGRFEACAVPYAEHIEDARAWKDDSAQSLEQLRFPFDTCRDGQREMARAVYRALRSGKNALIEAPTGTGKTAAALYGALKALARGGVGPIFYLTARTTGRRTALETLRILRARGARVRSVVITAKEKCCFLGKSECMACGYAAAYYDKRPEALRAALQTEDLNEEAIAELAGRFEMCPYELSLDLTEQADVVICDYNYVFDPRVHLRRCFDRKSSAGLLADEAHNLADRAREMFSAELAQAELSEALSLCKSIEGPDSPAAQALSALLSAFPPPPDAPEASEARPEALISAARDFAARIEESECAVEQVVDLMYRAQDFVRAAGRFERGGYRTIHLPEGNAVRLWCYDPGALLKAALGRVHGCAMFSATLTPLEAWAQPLGIDARDGDELMRLASPFDPARQLTCRLPVAVRYQDREKSMLAVCRIIETMALSHPGNYLACFPSFAYMNQAYERFRFECPSVRAIRQQGAMSEKARQDFIEQFQPGSEMGVVGFVVLGGVFAEGIDLPGDRLSGVAIVSTGLPQLDFENTLLGELLDDGFGSGRELALTIPGLRRVTQAAGRVIRTETDKGVVLLLDQRYDSPEIRRLLPEHWRVRRVRRLDDLRRTLAEFWQTD